MIIRCLLLAESSRSNASKITYLSGRFGKSGHQLRRCPENATQTGHPDVGYRVNRRGRIQNQLITIRAAKTV